MEDSWVSHGSLVAPLLQAALAIDEYSGQQFTHVSVECKRVNDRCIQASQLPLSECLTLQQMCLGAIAKRSDCQEVSSASVVLARHDELSIYGHSVARKTVHKDRRMEVELLRLRLPKVLPPRRVNSSRGSRSSNGFGGSHSNWLPSATLISPVWPNNFGETLLGTFYALHAMRANDVLLLAGSARLRREWSSYKSLWHELLKLTWPQASLRLLQPGTSYAVRRLRVCHLRDAFDEGRRAFQGMQPSLLGALVRQRLGIPPASRPLAPPVRIGIVVPGRHSTSPARRIFNADELISSGCPSNASCDALHLDRPGCLANLRAILPYHAIVAMHGAHMT